MFRVLPAIITISVLVGCASSGRPYEPPVKNRDRVTINEVFTDIPNGTRIQFQEGRRIPQGDLDKWTTWCDLYVYNKHRQADYVTTIQPGEFEIVAIQVRHSGSDAFHFPGRYRGFGYHYNRLPAYYLYHVGMRLTSPDQPDVKALDCYKKWGTRGWYYPTLNEIQQALGSLIEIRRLP